MTWLRNRRRDLRDVLRLGAPFLLHHAARWRRKPTVRLSFRYGRITVRPSDSDIATVRQVFIGRDYDLDGIAGGARVRQRYEDIVKAGGTPVIVDAGANIGAATLWFKLAFPAAHIVAVEPDAANAALLRANTAALADIRVVEAAIGSEAGFAAVAKGDQSWGVQTSRSVGGGCPIVTIEQCIRMVDGGTPLVAKIDIEGFEDDLFSTDLDWIDRFAAIFVEPHDWLLPERRSSRPMQRAMGLRDFDLFIQGENLIYIK